MTAPREPCIIRPNKPHVCIRPEHHHLHHPTERNKP